MKKWKMKEAKVKFSEVVELALKGEAQLITRRGKNVVVIVSYNDYRHLLQRNTTLLDIFSSAPRMDEHDLRIERDKTPIKPFRLE
jgi:antitoxin Phd